MKITCRTPHKYYVHVHVHDQVRIGFIQEIKYFLHGDPGADLKVCVFKKMWTCITCTLYM